MGVRRLQSGSTAFVEFNSPDAAEKAKSTLQSLKLFGRNLLVETATGTHPEKEPFPVAKNLGISFPSPPFLEYRYPRPNKMTLDNIMNAMVTVPIFYTQVLHLMNKMNLPPPFASEHPKTTTQKKTRKRKRAEMEEESDSLDFDDDEPAEVDENDDEVKEKKRRKLMERIKQVKDRTRIEIQHSKKPVFAADGSVTLTEGPVKIIIPEEEQENLHPPKENELFVLEQEKKNTWLQQCASLETLQSNKATLEEIRALPNMASFSIGEPTEKIFIKNLPKNVTPEEIYWLFGHLFPDEKIIKRDLEIKIMIGQMKGSAFVTFPTVYDSTQAITNVNGYKGMKRKKPLIIAFAKSKKENNPQKSSDEVTKKPDKQPQQQQLQEQQQQQVEQLQDHQKGIEETDLVEGVDYTAYGQYEPTNEGEGKGSTSPAPPDYMEYPLGDEPPQQLQ